MPPPSLAPCPASTVLAASVAAPSVESDASFVETPPESITSPASPMEAGAPSSPPPLLEAAPLLLPTEPPPELVLLSGVEPPRVIDIGGNVESAAAKTRRVIGR
jgi:hypothetical protein